MKQSKLWTKNFISISCSNVFLFLTFYFLLVTLPIYSLQQLHSNASGAGLMVTVFLISAIISRPIAGKWIERSGPRMVLLTALLVFFGASLFYFFPKTLLGFLFVRFLHGIGFGMATTVTGAIVANIIPTSRRGEGMGYFIMSTNLAMVLGPFIGLTTMQQWGPKVLFLISAIGALAALIAGLLAKLPKKEIVQERTRAPFSFKQYFVPSAVPISIIGAFFAIVYSSILSFVSVYAHQIHLGNVSSLFFVVYAIVLLISRPFTGKWFDQRGANLIIFPSIILFAIGMFVLSKSGNATSFLISAGMIGLGWGTIFPTLQTIAIQHVPPQKRGLATATFLSIFDIGIGFGSFVVGVIVSKISFSSFYLFGSVYLLAGVIPYYFLYTRKRKGLEENKDHESVKI